MTRNTNSHRRMTIQARNRHNWSEAHLNHSLLQLRLPRRKSISRPAHGLVKFAHHVLPSDIESPEGNSIYTVLEILPLRKAFLIGSQDLVAPDSRMWTTNTGAAASGGVGADKSSRRCPWANSRPTSLLLTSGTSFVPLFTSTQRTPITSLLDRLQRLFAEHDDKLSVL